MKKKLAIIALLTTLILAAIAAYLVSRRESIQNKILDSIIKKYSPQLPFKIESYQLAKDLKSLRLNLIWSGYRITIDGVLDLNWVSNADGWKIRYLPEITVDQATPVHGVLDLEITTDFKFLKRLQVQSDQSRPDSVFAWKAFGIDVQKPRLNFQFLPGEEITQADLSSVSVMWADPSNDRRAVSITAPVLTVKKQVGQWSAQAKVKGGELLWDAFYLDLPLQDLPLQISTADLKNFDLQLGRKRELAIQAKRPEAQGPWQVHWKTSRIDFAPLARWVMKMIPPRVWPQDSWSDLEWKDGAIQAQGSILIDVQKKIYQLQDVKLDGANLSFRSLSHSLMAKKVSFSVPYRQSEARHSGWIEALEIYFKQFPARLKRTEFTWTDRRFQTQGPVPLDLGGVLLNMGAIKAKINPDAEEEAYQVDTSLHITAPNFKFLTQGLCLPKDRIPPAQMKVDFSSIHFSPGVVDPVGKIRVNLFGGNIEMHDLGLFDLSTDVPEIDFDVDWEGIDLEQFTTWSHFGKMKGTLEGYAHEVVFQSFLPVQYRFLVQLKSLDQNASKPHIDVSPEAMKNIVMLFTGANLDDQIPGIAGWLMFGWLPHLIGGYDVYYAGVSLSSANGQIVLETLDPIDLFKDTKETQKHFFLYGPRFKMPLKAPEYPLILDATAMSNFVHQMMGRFGALKGDSEINEDQNQCHPPEL